LRAGSRPKNPRFARGFCFAQPPAALRRDRTARRATRSNARRCARKPAPIERRNRVKNAADRESAAAAIRCKA